LTLNAHCFNLSYTSSNDRDKIVLIQRKAQKVFGGSFQIGRLWGIPIRVHVTLLIVLPLIAFDFGLALRPPSIIWGVVAAIGLFTSIALHEVGHSLVGARKGCPARDILLLPIGGLAQLESMPRDPRDEFQVAIAGPAVSFLLAIIGWAAGIALSSAGMHRPGTVIMLLGAVNLMLALFNLLPSFPMDGGRIFRAWLTPKLGRLTATRVAAKVGRFMAIVFGIIGLLKLNVFLILIALFIYQAAGAEYRMVRIQEASRRSQSGPWVSLGDQWPYDEEIIVSPPPFETRQNSSFFVRPLRAQHDLFDELFEKWR